MNKRRHGRFQRRRRYRAVAGWLFGLLLYALGSVLWVHAAGQGARLSSTTQSGDNQSTVASSVEPQAGMENNPYGGIYY